MREGEAVTIRCTYSTTEDRYYVYWYMQQSAKEPQFVVWKRSWDPVEWKGSALGNRFVSDLQLSDSSARLTIMDLEPINAAVYYCAVGLTVIENSANPVQKLSSD